MSKGNVDKFLGLMQKDEGLARKMAACLYKLETNEGKAEGSGDFISREIVPLAKEYGLEFTAQDFFDYTEEAKTKVGLSDDDLAEVSGGKGGVRAALMGTLALVGVASAPVAVKLASGGEVAPFSMVASAANPNEEKSEQATPEQLEELQLGIAALNSLKETISSSNLRQEEKDKLEESRANILKTAEEAFNSKAKADVEKARTKIKDYLKKIKINNLTNDWLKARNKLLGLSGRLKKLEGSEDLDKGKIKEIKNDISVLKQVIIGLRTKKGTEKSTKDIESEISKLERSVKKKKVKKEEIKEQPVEATNVILQKFGTAENQTEPKKEEVEVNVVENTKENQKEEKKEQKKEELEQKKEKLEQQKAELKTALNSLQETFGKAVSEGYFEDKNEDQYDEGNDQGEYLAKQAKETLRLDTPILNADDGDWMKINDRVDSVNQLIEKLEAFIEEKKLKIEQDEIKELVENIGNGEVAVEEVADEANKAKLAKQIDIRIKAYEGRIKKDSEIDDISDLDYEDMPGLLNLMEIKAALTKGNVNISKETFDILKQYSNDELFRLDELYSDSLKKYAQQYEEDLKAAIERATEDGQNQEKIDEATRLKQELDESLANIKKKTFDPIVNVLIKVEEAIDSLTKKEEKEEIEEIEEKPVEKKDVDENVPLQEALIEEQLQAVAQREQENVVQAQEAVIVDVVENADAPVVKQENVKLEEQKEALDKAEDGEIAVAPVVKKEEVKPDEQKKALDNAEDVEDAAVPVEKQEDVKREELKKALDKAEDVKKAEEEKLAEAKETAKEPMAKLAQAITAAKGLGGKALTDAKTLQERMETALKGADANAINDAVGKIEGTIQALEKAVPQSLATNMKAKIDNVATELAKVDPKTKTDLETKLEEALNQATPVYEELNVALEGDDAKKISGALKAAHTQYDAFTGAIKTYLEGLKAEVDEALRTEADENRPYLVRAIDELKKDTSGYNAIDKQLAEGKLDWIQYRRIDIANIKTAKASYDKLDALKEFIKEKKEQLGEDSLIIKAAEAQEQQLRKKLNSATSTASLATGCAEQAEEEINMINAAVAALKALNDAKAAEKEPMEKLAQAIANAKGLGGQALIDATNLQKQLDNAKSVEEFNEAVEKIDETVEKLNAVKLPDKLNEAKNGITGSKREYILNIKLKRVEEKVNEYLSGEKNDPKDANAAVDKLLDDIKNTTKLKDDEVMGWIRFIGDIGYGSKAEGTNYKYHLKKINGHLFYYENNLNELANLLEGENELKADLNALKKCVGQETSKEDLEIEYAEECRLYQELLRKLLEQTKKKYEEVGGVIFGEIWKFDAQKGMFDNKKAFKKEYDKLQEAIAKANIKALQEEVVDLLKTKGANQNILNDIKGALDIAARDLTKENAADISKVLTEIKEKLKAEKENIKKIKADSKEKKQKEQEEKDKKANTVDFFNDTNAKAERTLPKLKDRLDGLENFVVKVQKRTDAASEQEAINRLRARIDSFGDVTYENAKDKATELENIEKEIESLMDVVYGFEENLSTRVKKPKKNIGEMLTFFKDEAKEAKDQGDVEEIEKLEQELAAISEQPTNALELNRVATRIGEIKVSIPQIKAMLNKATTLKNIAEQVDDRFTEKFDKIIKEIEAADSVEMVVFAVNKLINKENELKDLMRTEIIEANKTAHILHEIAKIFRLNQLKGNFLNLIDTFDKFNYGAAPIAELYNVYQEVENVSAAEKKLTEWLGEQIDALKEQATKLKGLATTANENQLAWKLQTIVGNLEKVKLEGDLAQISGDVATAKNSIDNFAKKLAPQLVKALEIDALLEQEVMGAEMQDELKAIKAGLPKADKANADTVVKAFDDVKAVKTKMANKLLEWHKILSEYHKKDYHKEGNEYVNTGVALGTLKDRADKMRAGADEVKLNAEKLKRLTNIALEIAGNLKTDIADVINRVKNYNGFGALDITAGTQANTLATFLKDKVGNVSDLKFVDKKTRETLAKDIKHIFDQIKIDQKTGEYYLPGFYNQLGAVNHDDLKLICEAYDVVAEDFGERSSYVSYNELSKEGTNLEKATYLSRTLHEVQRLDLLDVSPESRDALKQDVLEIGARIKSTPGWIYGQTLSLDGVDQKETKNMQDGLARILEFYNYINGQKYDGFAAADITAGTQANTLATFLKDNVGNVSDLKSVDKEARETLAKDIKHIFDQIKIDQKTGEYYLPGLYSQVGPVNHDDLKLICEAYDVVAEDFATNESEKRSKYNSFEILGATALPLKDKTEALIGALANVQRLDLLDVSSESRDKLKKDILEIGAKIKSTPGRIYGQTLSLDGVDKKETKNMQSGLAKILEFYNSIQAQMKAHK